jgi:hypothetical protein
MSVCGLDSSDSDEDPIASGCVCGNVPLGSIKEGNFLAG